MYALMAVLMLIAGIGHLAIWTRLHCFVHSLPYKQWLIDTAEFTTYIMSVLIPSLFLVWWIQQPLDWQAADGEPVTYSTLYYVWLVYGTLSVIGFFMATFLWLLYQRDAHIAAGYFNERLLASFNFDEKAPQWLTSTSTKIASMIPANQILRLEVDRKELFLPRLPQELDGFTITHLSDLHLKGHMAEDFYRKVVDQAQDLQSEMIMIAGDIFDRDKCFPWTETLAGLTADCGTYFILGNHENRLLDKGMARKVLVDEGMIDLGSRHLTLMIRNYPVLMAGNELPWHPPAADLDNFDPGQFEQRPFRILLSHSPDQINWARANDFDLMLAGHNHGGQIRLPVIGPLVSPSRYGTRYAGGTFFADPTLMHVSRGISGTSPLRWNCPPEITQLVLRTRA
ncbi:metallophosphoesterase [Bremerella sp. JC817]|uniref:metallophosphoesterase n=1 Tax=Bremerella sp. JC817 TaxID=3231756 RepID=UPI0034586253